MNTRARTALVLTGFAMVFASIGYADAQQKKAEPALPVISIKSNDGKCIEAIAAVMKSDEKNAVKLAKLAELKKAGCE